MGTTHSRRAEILKRVLSHINKGDYDEEKGYIVFGSSSVWDMIMDLTDPPDQRPECRLEDAVKDLVADSKVHDGRVEVAHRISLRPPPGFRTNAIDSLRPEERCQLRELIERAIREKGIHGSHPGAPSEYEVADVLDAAFTEEVLGKLPRIVDRASGLDGLNLEGVPEGVKCYFEEAHRCYLYGFHVACAVLCRAILESALKSSVDPKGLIKGSLPKGRSYFKELVDNAKLLQDRHDGRDDRPCALDVKRAGDLAIHNLKEFREIYGGERLPEVLYNARKVLLDLYASKEAH